jgi:hypothetical protein
LYENRRKELTDEHRGCHQTDAEATTLCCDDGKYPAALIGHVKPEADTGKDHTQ